MCSQEGRCAPCCPHCGNARHAATLQLGGHMISDVIVTQPYYVDEEDFWKACDRNDLLVINRYLTTGGDVDACDAVSPEAVNTL